MAGWMREIREHEEEAFPGSDHRHGGNLGLASFLSQDHIPDTVGIPRVPNKVLW